MYFFKIIHQEKHSHARTGVIHTAHGDIETPAFMPVGTQATVKSLDPRDLREIGAPIVLGNTYHLHLRPGEDLIAQLGGLHRFMGWAGPILTDSGGFQVFSLGKSTLPPPDFVGGHLPSYKGRTTLSPPHTTCPDQSIGRRGGSAEGRDGVVESLTQTRGGGGENQGKLVVIDDAGVTFRSHIDGSEHRFTPESAIEMQHKLGADIIMAFDECTPDQISKEYAREAMERTHRWAEKSLAYHKNKKIPPQRDPAQGGTQKQKNTYRQFLFGIIQGAQFENLRKESARFISSLPFAGIAIGGESIGYNMTATKKILEWIRPLIPADRPRYTMGVGSSPLDIFAVVERGVDMFDCVAPTRLARNGTLYIKSTPPTRFARHLPSHEGRTTLSPPHTTCPDQSIGRRGGSAEGRDGVVESLTQTRGGGENKRRLNITNARFAADPAPIDPACDCSTCAQFSRAYLHHLFNANELLAFRLATIHNLRFMLKLMEEIREAIKEDRLEELKSHWM